MTRVRMLEMVRYYDQHPWKSDSGKLTFWQDHLAFQSFNEILIPLNGIIRISLETGPGIRYRGLELPDIEFKPKDMYFLPLDFDTASVVVLGKMEQRTMVIGSCYHDVRQANAQMANIRSSIYRARTNVLYEQRMALGGRSDQLQASSNGTSKEEDEQNKESSRQNKYWEWLRGILHPSSSLYGGS